MTALTGSGAVGTEKKRFRLYLWLIASLTDGLYVGEGTDDPAVLTIMLYIYPPAAGIFTQTHALFPCPDLEFSLIPLNGFTAFHIWG